MTQKIHLSLISAELKRQNKTQKALAEYSGITQPTMVRIFQKNDCSINQFEKMVAFLSCEGSTVSDFIKINGQILSKYISSIEERCDFYQQRAAEITDLRKQLIDKERVIRLCDEIKKQEQKHKEEIDKITGELQKAQRANYR